MNDEVNEQIPEQLKPLIPDFIQNRQDELQTIHDAARKNNYEVIRKIAHDWRGYSRPYGFGKLEAFADQLKAACLQENSEAISALHEEIKTYLTHKQKSQDV